MIPGDGIGPELMTTVKDVFNAAGVPVDFEEIYARYVLILLRLLLNSLTVRCKQGGMRVWTKLWHHVGKIWSV
jgi:isocitrate dehydrogenase (NAD+)